jgi:hypothetical protein
MDEVRIISGSNKTRTIRCQIHQQILPTLRGKNKLFAEMLHFTLYSLKTAWNMSTCCTICASTGEEEYTVDS